MTSNHEIVYCQQQQQRPLTTTEILKLISIFNVKYPDLAVWQEQVPQLIKTMSQANDGDTISCLNKDMIVLAKIICNKLCPEKQFIFEVENTHV